MQGAAGQNKQHSANKNTAKLDRETEELHHSTIDLSVSKLIQQGRQAKGYTQKELATVSSAFNSVIVLVAFESSEICTFLCLAWCSVLLR